MNDGSTRLCQKWKHIYLQISFCLFPYWKQRIGNLQIYQILEVYRVRKQKQNQDRLFSIGRLVHRAEEGISQAELARQLGVSRSTLTKDMGIVERETGVRFWEDDNGRLHWSEYND